MIAPLLQASFSELRWGQGHPGPCARGHAAQPREAGTGGGIDHSHDGCSEGVRRQSSEWHGWADWRATSGRRRRCE